MKRKMAKLLCVGFFLPCLAWAQEQDDVPGRGVARVSLINGDVSVRRGDSGDWVAAAVNGPMVVYDHLLTGPNSRAEIQFDYANMLRLSGETEVRLSGLEDKQYQVQLARGTVTLAVLRDSDAQIEVDTPNVSVRPVKRGMYRITVDPDGQSAVTVREGEAEAYTPRGVERVQSGRTMLVRGTANDPEFQMVSATAWDNWDRWNDDRDHRLERSQSYRYVSRDIDGADDLDAYGRWVNVPPYGWVWSPYGVASDWAPYRNGRWSWVDWYGWTWIDYEPWGWAPYHYGRWFYGAPYGWCWFPGPVGYHHYWRPALVAFFGFGHGVGVGIGFGNVGWVPLAPYEPYYPWYGRRYYGGYRNTTYIDNSVHIVNNTNITSIYRNARVRNGISGIDSGDFVRGRTPRSIAMTDGQIQRAALVRGPMPVSPVAESLRLSDRQVRMPSVPRNEPTSFSTRRQVPAVERIPFDEQRRGMEQVVHRTFNRTAGQGTQSPVIQGGRSEGFRGSPAAPAATANPGGSVGWRRVDQPAQQVTQPNRSPDWRQFGEPGNRGAAPAVATPRVERTTPDSGSRDAGRSRNQMMNNQSNDNWRNLGSSSSESSPVMRQERSVPSQAPRFEQRSAPAPRMERSEPIRVNPPIVRERSQPRSESRSTSAPRSSGGESRSSGGGGGRSTGGGGARSSGGGGGRNR